MRNGIIFFIVLLLAITGCNSGRTSEAGSAEKPNILLIMVDPMIISRYLMTFLKDFLNQILLNQQ